jgi:nicotinate-nucleotide pyrophosphorylase (carboxylating)
MALPKKILEEKLRRFVEEDVGHGDVTAFHTIPHGTVVEAKIIVKEKGVIAGVEEALALSEVFGLKARALVKDGSKVMPRTEILHIEGDAITLLTIERTMLNLFSRMSGIASHTNRLVEMVRRAGYKTVVAATRKTALGLGHFDKKAVEIGGGDPHRHGLDDMILIKDNHLAIAGNVKNLVRKTREKASFSKKIEVEVSRLSDVLEAAEAGADIVMLDNLAPKKIEEAVQLLKKKRLRNKIMVEASGGITERNILRYAAAGVNIVSLGEITQSARALDMSLEVVRVKKGSRD